MKSIYRISLLGFLFLQITNVANAQSGMIEGSVFQDGAQVGFATIALRVDATEALIKASVTDEYGKYTLKQIP